MAVVIIAAKEVLIIHIFILPDMNLLVRATENTTPGVENYVYLPWRAGFSCEVASLSLHRVIRTMIPHAAVITPAMVPPTVAIS